MKLLQVITPSSVYHVCSTRKTFREEKFTPVNIKDCICQNVRKHRDTKDGEKCITLEISLVFGNMDNTKTTLLEPKDYAGRLGKGLITSLGLKTIRG